MPLGLRDTCLGSPLLGAGAQGREPLFGRVPRVVPLGVGGIRRGRRKLLGLAAFGDDRLCSASWWAFSLARLFARVAAITSSVRLARTDISLSCSERAFILVPFFELGGCAWSGLIPSVW